MKKFCTAFLLCLPALLQAQTPNIQWQKTFGGTSSDLAAAVRPTPDKGFIVTGIASSTNGDVTGNHGASDHWVLKLDSTGAVQWKHAYGGTGGDNGYDIRPTSDGGYVFTGYTNSTDGDVSGAHGSTDYWVVKIDSLGVIQWQKALGGNSADNAYNVIQTLDGGYAVIGLSATTNGSGNVSSSNGGQDYWLCKLDAAGTLQWQKSYGGTSTEQCFGLVQTADSGYVMCGYSSSTNGMVTGNHGGTDYWIVKADVAGNLLWQRSYGGTLGDRAFNIGKTNDGGFIVNGVSPSTDGDVIGNHGGNDYWVLKLDSLGILQWQKSIGGTGDDFGRGAIQTLDGGYVLGGRTNTPNDGDVTGNHGDYDYWIVKLGGTGTLLWQKCIGGTAGEGQPGSTVPFTTIMELPDGKLIMCGSTYSTNGDAAGNVSTGASDDNYWVVKLYGCPARSSMADTICNGESYTFNGQQFTTSGVYYDTLLSASGCDSVIALNLTVRPPMQVPVITASGTALSGNGPYTTYQWLLNGQPISGATNASYTATANGSYTLAVTDANGCADTSAAQSITGIGVKDISLAENINIYPNPVKNQVNISCPFEMNEINLALYSMEGQLVLSGTYHKTYNVQFSVAGISNGIYMLKITDINGRTAFRKIVKN